MHDCPCCTCGMIQLFWSDREPYVFNDPESIANAVVNCALDHSYDRGDGVPHGLDDETSDRLRPIVAAHLAAKNLDWLNHSVHMTDEERNRFYADVLGELRKS